MDNYGTFELMQTLDWAVQDDPAELDGASKEMVRQRFRDWATAASAAPAATASADDDQPTGSKKLVIVIINAAV